MYVQIFYNYIADKVYFHMSFSLMQYLGMSVTLGFMLMAALKKLKDERMKKWIAHNTFPF